MPITDILRKIDPGRRICLFLDYDGTLVTIKKTPGLAVLLSSRRTLLQQLSQRIFVGIVSGRSLADIQRLIASKNIAYIGNHGLEISFRRRHWVHPDVRRTKKALKDVLGRIRRRAMNMPGVLVEDKGGTGSIHYRGLAIPLHKKLREIVEYEARRRGRDLKLTEGKKVVEIRPNVKWDKGRGVRELGRRLDINKSALLIYIGDDQTDEDAFRALGPKHITILVGRKRVSHARYRLADVNAVWRLLKVLKLISAPPEFGKRPRRPPG